MTSSIKPLRSPGEPNLGQQAANMLRRAIIAGEFPSGVRLIEDDLASRLGVSRGPIREALRQLATEGLVEVGRRGAFVRLGQHDIWELYSLRTVLEGFAIELAAQAFTDDDMVAVQGLLDQMAEAAQAQRLEDFVILDMAFHSAFFERAGHRRLLLSWQALAPSIGAMLAVTSTANPRVDSILDEHQQILEGVKTRDVATAQQWLRIHLADAREVIERTYQQERPNFPAG
jgi:GntR family transcriptional regulator of gluconate operon